MYKYKGKEFEVIEMASPSNWLSWGTPFDSRAVDQAEWRTFWGVSGEDLEGALEEIFYGQMERTRVSRSRRSGMSAMASAVEIQRTLGIP